MIETILKKIDTKFCLGLIIIIGGFLFIKYGGQTEVIDARVFDLMFLVGSYYFGASSGGTKLRETMDKIITKNNEVK